MSSGWRIGDLGDMKADRERAQRKTGTRTDIGFRRPTLRGLTVGKVTVTNEDSREDVCVWGEQCPSWIFFLTELGLRARTVVVKSEKCVRLIQQVVEADCTIMVREIFDDTADQMMREGMSPKLMLVDGGPTIEVMTFARGTHVTRIITTRVGR